MNSATLPVIFTVFTDFQRCFFFIHIRTILHTNIAQKSQTIPNHYRSEPGPYLLTPIPIYPLLRSDVHVQEHISELRHTVGLHTLNKNDKSDSKICDFMSYFQDYLVIFFIYLQIYKLSFRFKVFL